MSDKTIVVTSATPEADYSFPLPLTCLLWRELVGFEPIVYLVSSSAWLRPGPKACVDALKMWGFKVIEFYPIEGHDNVVNSKHVREHAAVDPGIAPDTWIMPADADLWPLQCEFYHQHEGAQEKAVLYYANGDGFKSKAETITSFQEGRRFPTIPLCHATMRAREWRQSWELHAGLLASSMRQTFANDGVSDASRVPPDEIRVGWEWWVRSDQRVLTWRLCQQPWFHDKGQGDKVRYIERSKRKGPPDDRLDRGILSDWTNLGEKFWVDSHIFKQPQLHQHWLKLYALFALRLPKFAEWSLNYHRQYLGG